MGELYQLQASSTITSRVHQTYSAIRGVTGYGPYWQPYFPLKIMAVVPPPVEFLFTFLGVDIDNHLISHSQSSDIFFFAMSLYFHFSLEASIIFWRNREFIFNKKFPRPSIFISSQLRFVAFEHMYPTCRVNILQSLQSRQTQDKIEGSVDKIVFQGSNRPYHGFWQHLDWKAKQ